MKYRTWLCGWNCLQSGLSGIVLRSIPDSDDWKLGSPGVDNTHVNVGTLSSEWPGVTWPTIIPSLGPSLVTSVQCPESSQNITGTFYSLTHPKNIFVLRLISQEIVYRYLNSLPDCVCPLNIGTESRSKYDRWVNKMRLHTRIKSEF